MERITVIVVPNAKRQEVSRENDCLRVSVTAPAKDGKANRAVIEALADFLQVKKSAICIVHGRASRRKVIEII